MLLNKKIKQIFAVLAGILVLSVASYAQTSQDALIQRYLEKANAEFDDGNIEGAYKNINATLNSLKYKPLMVLPLPSKIPEYLWL